MSEPCRFCHGDHSEPLHGCPTVGVRAGGGDDAIHIVAATEDAQTLCGLDAPSRNAMPEAKSTKLNGWDGCWTCLIRRDERVAA